MQMGIKSSGLVDRLKLERDRFVAFAFASADILMEVSSDGKVLYVDGAVEKLLGEKAEQIEGKSFVSLINEDDQDIAEYLLGTNSKSRVDNVVIRLKSSNSQNFPFVMSGYKVSELYGHYYLTFSTFRSDLSTNDLARRDLRSGLLRKGEYSIASNRNIALSKFTEELPYMTMVMASNWRDLSNRLPVYELLKAISDLVRSESINGDSAGLIEENLYAFNHYHHINHEELCHRLNMLAAEISGNNELVFTASSIKLEIAETVDEEDTVQSIVYAVNKFRDSRGQNYNYQTLGDCYKEMSGDTVNRLSEFKRIVKDELFDLAYQPIVEVETGAVVHFEVLTRLKDSKVFSNPFQFIEFGENVGLISDFDLKLLSKAMIQLKILKSQGKEPVVAVNMSGFSLSSKNFLDTVYAMFVENMDVSKQIIVEITESSKIGNIKVANEYVQKFRRIGVRCSIDDFGTGEATFEYLRNFEVDIVKIDGSYINEDAIKSPNGRHLLRAIGRLCKDMGVDVVGEKVENAACAALLMDCGIKYGQGYYYDKPTSDLAILDVKGYEVKKASVLNIQDYL